MRKILFLLLAGLLWGCTQASNAQIMTYSVDMSLYQGVTNSPIYKGIADKELFKAIREDRSLIVYVGYSQFESCQQAVALLDDSATKSHATIYYLNVQNEKYPFDQQGQEQLAKLFMDHLKEDISKITEWPLVFSIVKGKIKNYQFGMLDDKQLADSYDKIIADVY